MKEEKIQNFVSIILIIILLITPISIVYSASSTELKQQQSDIQKKINETNSEIKDVKNQKSSTLSQIENMMTEVSSYKDEIDEMESKLSELNSEISVKENSIKEKQEKYNESQQLLNERLVAMYETGTTTYLDLLLNSEGLADFISKYYLISQLAEYDTNLMNKIIEEKEVLENEKKELDGQKEEIETTKTNIEAKSKALGVIVDEKNRLVANLSEEEKALQKELEELEADKRAITAELAAIAAKNNYKLSVTPSTAGYISPLAGRTRANITTAYGSYSWGGNHTGVDFAVPAGTPILAVKAGTVVTSKALKNSNGNYRSYGEYIVIDHHDGTMTLYGHGSPGSRKVSVGDTVSQGQQIMSVGTTGNSTGNHLHFEVRIGGRAVNPTSYLP